jgi:branched-chain amino acid transport system ATP-binding protein/nonpolar-amino-acid-transporting ATPase
MMLEIHSLVSGYGALTVLHDISLSIRDREAVAIVGANGAGKTTLVRTICGLLRARSGRIVKNGVDISRTPTHEMADHRIAVVLENRRLFGELTVRENLLLAERRRRDAHKVFDWADIYTLFPMIEERLETPVNLLSGGQQQMVAIARALLLQPDLLIMDEPSTGLAPKVVKDILNVIKELRGRGMALLLVEQNVGIAAAITDRAYVLALGRIEHEIQPGAWDAFLKDERLVKAYLGS